MVNCKLNPIGLRKAKIIYNFCLSECSRVKAPKMKIVEFANSIGLDVGAHNEPFHLDLHYLPFGL